MHNSNTDTDTFLSRADDPHDAINMFIRGELPSYQDAIAFYSHVIRDDQLLALFERRSEELGIPVGQAGVDSPNYPENRANFAAARRREEDMSLFQKGRFEV